jgi:hypothetical protein
MMTLDSKTRENEIDIRHSTASIAQEGMLEFTYIPNGTLVKLAHNPSPIWMVIDGRRYGYTSWAKFISVHKDGPLVEVLADPDRVPEGEPFGDDLELITYPNGPVYLLNHGKKRGFTSAAIFNQYQYNWSKIKVYSAGVVAAIPELPPFPA